MTTSNASATTAPVNDTVVLPGNANNQAAASAAAANYPGFVPAPTASLYVGELLPEINEAMLFELFSQVGPVASIRICRDAITRRSLGYAYVNYHSVQDCERALDTLNYCPIKGNPCRIMWSQRDPSLRRSGTGNIFIKNLDPAIDNKALHDTFSAFGNILSCKVALDDKGQSRGYGFVHYETQEAADMAIEKVNGMLLNDRQVFVGRHVSKKERAVVLDVQKASFTNVYVKNLDESVTDEDLSKLFEPFGEITSAVVQRDAEGKSKLFGFVNFADHDNAQKAVDSLNNTELKGKTVFVGRAQKRNERDEELRRQFEAFKLERMSKFTGVNLYIKNLCENIDEERLKHEFSPFGTITSCKIMSDEKGNSRGFGFVCFGSPEESQRALTEMNGRMLNGKPLYVSMAQRKDERRAQLEAQYTARMRMNQQAAATGMGIFQQGPLFYPSTPAGAGAARFGNSGPPAGYVPRAVGPMVGMPPGAVPPGGMPMRPTGPRPFRQGPGFRSNASSGNPIMNGPRQDGATMPRRQFYGNRPMYPPGTAPFRRGPMLSSMEASTGILTASALAAASPEQRKQMIGERLYPLVQARLMTADTASLPAPDQLAGKITGMLLELDNPEVLNLLDSPESLTERVQEALEVLHQHNH